VEGEKKALALWRLANHESSQPRFIPIALAGVWNWRGTIGKTGGRNGERLDVKGPIADLSRINCDKRTVFIVFDANVHTNESVKWARKGIARELATRSAEVKLVNLPEDCGMNGIDDLLAAWGPTRVLDLFEGSVSGAKLQVVQPPQFQARPEGMFRVTTKGEQLSQVQLTSYQAARIAIADLTRPSSAPFFPKKPSPKDPTNPTISSGRWLEPWLQQFPSPQMQHRSRRSTQDPAHSQQLPCRVRTGQQPVLPQPLAQALLTHLQASSSGRLLDHSIAGR
jgi:hypothetical protein